MDVFRYQSGKLWCENILLESLAECFGTPAYVYSQGAILGNFSHLKQSLALLPNLICYSVKANSNLRILKLLSQAGAGFDVVSGGELARALRAGAIADRIVFSGVGKTEAEIDAGLGAGIGMFNVESRGELELIERRARALGRPARIAIRVNPEVEARTHAYISTGQIIHKFGVPKDEALELYRRAACSSHMKIHGVACHIGSQILDVEPFLKALDEILALAAQLEAEGLRIEYLDLGGGYGIRYADEQPLDFETLGRRLEERLRATQYRLIVEPGRALVGNAGLLLTRVLYVKRNRQKNFIVVDAGMNDLMRPALYGSYHEIIPVRDHPGDRLEADVVGPLCETGDFLAQDRKMPDVQPGDLLAILAAGAYGFVLSSNYNTRPRPAEVLIHGSQAELIRPRETLEELMAGEHG
ncbi:MAG TPA: diaminopimelate decarboxylase [Terriglobia bacterium]|nr:diaminopimelate decarboxylase [Terriglobia bacterium]